MAQFEKVIYTAKTRTSGGRDGTSRSTDGRLDIRLSSPGSQQGGTNPEQLFAAGWSACFLSALKLEASRMKLSLPADVAIDAEVDLGITDGVYGLAARLNVHLPDLPPEVAQRLTAAAHQICPYSRATRGNVDVAVNVISSRTPKA
jgi:osmotically inducible protein OsmC